MNIGDYVNEGPAPLRCGGLFIPAIEKVDSHGFPVLVGVSEDGQEIEPAFYPALFTLADLMKVESFIATRSARVTVTEVYPSGKTVKFIR